MEKNREDELWGNRLGTVLRRTYPRVASEEHEASSGQLASTDEGISIDQAQGAQAAALDEFAQRIVAVAQDAAADYIMRSQQQCEAIIAEARARGANELAEAREIAASTIAQAESTARHMLQEAGDAQQAALAEARTNVETLLHEVGLEAARIKQNAMLAAAQEADGLLETARAEAERILSDSRVQAEAEGQRIHNQLVSEAEAKAQQLHAAAVQISAEAGRRVLELAESVAKQLRSADLALGQTTIEDGRQDTDGRDLDTTSRARLDGDCTPAAEGGVQDGEESIEPREEDNGHDGSQLAQVTSAPPKVSNFMLMASPLRGFAPLMALEGTIDGLLGVIHTEVQEIGRDSVRLNVAVTDSDSASFLTKLSSLAGVRSVSAEDPALIRLVLEDRG